MATFASERIHTARVLVVGDMMLDRYWFGDVDWISPGAPVSVMQIKRQDERLGGAVNVVRGVAALSAQAAMLGMIDDNEPGRSIETLLGEGHITGHLHRDPAVNTTIELCVLTRQQQLIRVDFESTPTHKVLMSMLDRHGTLMPQHDVVVLPDYSKGDLTYVGKMIGTSRQAGRRMLVSPKGDDYSRYKGATMITPNRAEMRQVVGPQKLEQDLAIRAQNLRRELQLKVLLLTHSKEGMTPYTRHKVLHMSAQAHEVLDVSGAGDAVIATLATLLGADTNIKEAAQYANRVGGIVVDKLGTAVVTHTEFFNQSPNRRIMTIIVTGAVGFISANIVKDLDERDETDIIAVDNLTQADKFKNIVDCQVNDYLDETDFVEHFTRGGFGRVHAIFHEGACSDTMETDGRCMMDNNYRYSLAVMRACLDQGMQFLYAFSAATYGASETFREEPHFERPLNVYDYSKLLFDQIMRRVMPTALSQIVGFRYFNVCGPHEQHKDRMASVASHNFSQFRAEGIIKLFGEYNGYPQGDQICGFVPMGDMVKVSLFFSDNLDESGTFNLDTDRAQSFNDIVTTIVNTLRTAEGKPALSTEELAQGSLIEYVKFSDTLRGRYQCSTQADQSRLRAVGYTAPFLTMQEGVERYCQWLLKQPA